MTKSVFINMSKDSSTSMKVAQQCNCPSSPLLITHVCLQHLHCLPLDFGCIETCSYVSWMIWLMSLTLKRLKCTPAVLLTDPLYLGAHHCERKMPKCQYCMNSVYLNSCRSTYSLLILRFLSCADGQSYANARHFPVLRQHRTLLRCDGWWNVPDH